MPIGAPTPVSLIHITWHMCALEMSGPLDGRLSVHGHLLATMNAGLIVQTGSQVNLPPNDQSVHAWWSAVVSDKVLSLTTFSKTL